MPPSSSSVAILLDAENARRWVQEGLPERLIDAARTMGRPTVRRAFADWFRGEVKSSKDALEDAGFDLIHHRHIDGSKNTCDILLAAHAVALAVGEQQVDAFVLATGDSDFAPLFRFLREQGCRVVGAGPESRLSEFVRRNCDGWVVIEEAGRSTPTARARARPRGRDEGRPPASSVAPSPDGPSGDQTEPTSTRSRRSSGTRGTRASREAARAHPGVPPAATVPPVSDSPVVAPILPARRRGDAKKPEGPDAAEVLGRRLLERGGAESLSTLSQWIKSLSPRVHWAHTRNADGNQVKAFAKLVELSGVARVESRQGRDWAVAIHLESESEPANEAPPEDPAEA